MTSLILNDVTTPVALIFKFELWKTLVYFFPNSLYIFISWALPVKLVLSDYHGPQLMISQYCFRYWLGAIWHQAITWTNIEPDLCCPRPSLGHNKLTQTVWVNCFCHICWCPGSMCHLFINSHRFGGPFLHRFICNPSQKIMFHSWSIRPL